MSRTKNSFFTLLTVALVAVFMTGVSFGGDTEFTAAEGTRSLMSERASTGQSWNPEGGAKADRNMAFVPGGNNIFFDLTLANADGSTPAPTWDSVANLVTIDIAQTNPDAFDYVGVTNLSQALVNGDTTLRVSWDSTANPVNSFATATIFFGGHDFTDENNAVGGGGGYQSHDRDTRCFHHA